MINNTPPQFLKAQVCLIFSEQYSRTQRFSIYTNITQKNNQRLKKAIVWSFCLKYGEEWHDEVELMTNPRFFTHQAPALTPEEKKSG